MTGSPKTRASIGCSCSLGSVIRTALVAGLLIASDGRCCGDPVPASPALETEANSLHLWGSDHRLSARRHFLSLSVA